MDTRLELLSRISYSNKSKILLIIIDGLGGLYHDKYKKTELQYANLPNLDNFVRERQTVTGLIYPVRRGIIPGSGVGHLGLFGYDPLFEEYKVGRGALEAADLPSGEINPGDITARFNFCTINNKGIIIDRRANRFTDGKKIAEILNKEVKINNITTKVISTKEHRGVFIMKNGQQLSAKITDTDPQKEGFKILKAKPDLGLGINTLPPAAIKSATIVNEYTKQAIKILKDKKPANGIIFRGFSTIPDLPHFNVVYSLNSAAIAAYPLYRGIAKLISMKVLGPSTDLKSEIDILKKNFKEFDFFFLHYKDPDLRGEDGDFLGKVKTLEYFDKLFPEIRKLDFDVLAITGDHSTPSIIGAHSDHSVPIAINSKFMKGFDRSQSFDEEQCIYGSLGRLEGVELMTILLAKARKLRKFEGFEK